MKEKFIRLWNYIEQHGIWRSVASALIVLAVLAVGKVVLDALQNTDTNFLAAIWPATKDFAHWAYLKLSAPLRIPLWIVITVLVVFVWAQISWAARVVVQKAEQDAVSFLQIRKLKELEVDLMLRTAELSNAETASKDAQAELRKKTEDNETNQRELHVEKADKYISKKLVLDTLKALPYGEGGAQVSVSHSLMQNTLHIHHNDYIRVLSYLAGAGYMSVKGQFGCPQAEYALTEAGFEERQNFGALRSEPAYIAVTTPPDTEDEPSKEEDKSAPMPSTNLRSRDVAEDNELSQAARKAAFLDKLHSKDTVITIDNEDKEES